MEKFFYFEELEIDEDNNNDEQNINRCLKEFIVEMEKTRVKNPKNSFLKNLMEIVKEGLKKEAVK